MLCPLKFHPDLPVQHLAFVEAAFRRASCPCISAPPRSVSARGDLTPLAAPLRRGTACCARSSSAVAVHIGHGVALWVAASAAT
jgi:hypothetical protein